MARRYEKDIGVEGLHIECICFDDGEGMVGDAEEEVVIECSIDQTEEISLSRLHA